MMLPPELADHQATESALVYSETGGAGIGFWVNKNFTTRMEMRYQNYTAKYFETEKDMDMAVGSVQMGWLL